jgi:hypothetical protein
MSALTPKTDVRPQILDVRFVPKADIQRRDEVSAGRHFTRLAARLTPARANNLCIALLFYYSV